ncbi:MAG: maleylpyruvate isomerase N-terminal domain-containing protein, partial [Actinomycetota bacterium]
MASDDQLRDAMAKTMAGFAAVVAALEPQHWDLPSPCTQWSVFDVVDHVVAGERFTVEVLAGASLAEAVEAQAGLDPQNADAVGQVTDAAAAALAAFDGSLDRIIDHRVGRISARRMLGFRIIDQLG